MIDSETSEARKFIEKDIYGFSHWTLYKFCENRKQNCEFKIFFLIFFGKTGKFCFNNHVTLIKNI